MSGGTDSAGAPAADDDTTTGWTPSAAPTPNVLSAPATSGWTPTVGPPQTPGPAAPIQPGPANWGPWPSGARSSGAATPGVPPGPIPYATSGPPGTAPSATDPTVSAPGWQATPPGDGWRERGRRSDGPGSGPIVVGLLLILGGAFLLARELVPDLRVALVWPVAVMVLGGLLILLAFLRPPRHRRR